MKEITQQIKERIFALYYGQKVWNRIGWPGLVVNGVVDFKGQFTSFSDGDTKTFLELKSLSDITEEDLEAISFNFPTGTEGVEFDFQFDNYKFHWKAKRGLNIKEGYLSLKDFDYLRSKGYALPAMGFSVSELVDKGVFKLIENEK